MAEEQPPTLTEEPQEEATRRSPQSSGTTEESTINAMEDAITTPEETSPLEEKTNEDTFLVGLPQRDEQTVATNGDTNGTGKEVTEKEGGDTLASSEELTEDYVTSEGEKAGTGANEESSSTQEESAGDLSGHKVEKFEDAASSQEVPAATDHVDDKSTEELTQPSAKNNADKVEDSKPEASSTKDSITGSPGKEAAQEKEQRDRKSELPRSRTMPKSYGRATRKDIAEKFGGVSTSGVRVQRSTSCGAGAVKNMLLEWCRAKTRGREGVDIQNFSSSWSSGLAFCALMLAFFPDAFDYDSLDPKNRRENFQLAFNAAEEYADCPPLLDVEDMVRMKVPDSKCVYTYVQELYRSLVAKGLVKTKKA
ncbi:smoothelin-like protein 1 [Rhinoderma darwinii]|uniref:smoothelin-like protein 1 n=1 Tax=Rhinoderma darwinii TaxID=43563 RepID=UPI003F66D174